MIFYLTRLVSFLAFVCCATLLVSCSKKEAVETPARVEDDKVAPLIDKELAALNSDKDKMKLRLDKAKLDLEENALRPKLLDFSRKEYFRYEKLDRQIDQQIAYYKIRKALRDKSVRDRLGKLTVKTLDKELTDYEIEIQTNKPVFPWRSLPEPEKAPAGKEPAADGKAPPAAH